MNWFSLNRSSVLVVALSTVVAGCESVPTRDPTGPEDPTVQRLDPQRASLLMTANTWAPKHALPTARSHHKAATLNGLIYVVGGQNASFVNLSRVDAYDASSNTWSPRRSMPNP